METESSGLVQSVERAIALLDAVASGGADGESAAELAARVGLNRATAWRLLATLEAHGLVEKVAGSNRYGVGFAVVRMAASANIDGLVRRAHPVLLDLSAETGETADLAVMRSMGLTYVDEVTPPVVLAAKWIGRPVPLHATSSGKTLLAHLSDSEVDALLSGPLAALTNRTITERDGLRREIDATRARGYGICVGECEDNLNGVSAPVVAASGRLLAVVSIWGPDDRVDPARFDELGAKAQSAAARIAAALRHERGGDGRPAASS